MTFDTWIEENRDELILLLRNDAELALHKAYVAGQESIGDYLASLNSNDIKAYK